MRGISTASAPHKRSNFHSHPGKTIEIVIKSLIIIIVINVNNLQPNKWLSHILFCRCFLLYNIWICSGTASEPLLPLSLLIKDQYEIIRRNVMKTLQKEKQSPLVLWLSVNRSRGKHTVTCYLFKPTNSCRIQDTPYTGQYQYKYQYQSNGLSPL